MSKKRQYKRDKRSPVPKSDAISKIMSSIKGKGTKPEIRFRKALFSHGIKGYRINYDKLPGKPDIAFVKRKFVIFIHGCFWHGCIVCGRRIPKHNSEYWLNKIEKNIARDDRQKKALEAMGYRVVELWEHELKGQFEEMVIKVVKLLTI